MNDKILLGIYAVKDTASGGFSGTIHDHNFAAFSRGSLKNYIHLERITRRKFDARFEDEAESLMRRLKLAGETNVELCFVDHELGKSFSSHGGQIRFEASSLNDPMDKLNSGIAHWFGRKVPAYWLSHELAHIYSCIPYFGNFREGSLLIHFDGGASRSNFSVWEYSGGHIRKLAHHYKLKEFTGFFNANALVFKLTGTPPAEHNSVAGKFMGLAAYGTYRQELEQWLEKHHYFWDIWKSQAPFLTAVKKDWGLSLKQIDNRNPFLQDIAASMHKVFIRETLKEISHFAQGNSYRYLYFTGGCALNIHLNSSLQNSGMFEEVFIPPCTNDSGLSLGAATALALKNKIPVPLIDPYINGYESIPGSVSVSKESLLKVAELLSEDKFVGVCNSFGEAGPRALGNRSILCRADNPDLARKLSRVYKRREWYRPLAPVVLENQAKICTGLSSFPQAAAYMLFEFPILEEYRDCLAGAVHTDGSARLQIVSSRKQNPFIFDLLHVCQEKYGMRGLVNTSFNAKGEPIVQTHEEARLSAVSMGLDALVLDGELLALT